jgi:radical SAM superfamily enzyme YgiQ (UPF0313 family)
VKEPGAIVLVACYELGHQPLAVAWPAAFLERAGYRPAVMDIAIEPFDAERVEHANLVAISVPMHTALRLGVDVARRVREVNPRAHVCFFGLYAVLNAEHLLAHGADSVIGGEIEDTLVAHVRNLERGDTNGARERAENGARERAVLARLDFPVPSRRALPALDKYARLERDGRLETAGYVEASRGCLHLCRHCPIPPVYRGRFFAVPRDVVLADVRQLVASGATHVTFGDPDFLNGPTHALRIARAVHAEFPALTFDFTAKVEHLVRHADMIPEFAALGCVFIVSAVESLSDTVLTHLAKGHTRRDVETALAATRAAGIALRPTWVPFTPWTTLDDYREMLDFIDDNALIDHVDAVQYAIRLLVPPGSLLLESDAMRPHLRELVAESFYYRWTHPDPRVDRLSDRVASVVAAAADAREDGAITFARVRELADEAAGVRTRVRAPVDRERPRPPRLTEPWFC